MMLNKTLAHYLGEKQSPTPLFYIYERIEPLGS